MPSPTPVHQLKITLRGSRPSIWRRVHVPARITLRKMHGLIQAVMGWEDYHLHDFKAGGELYGMPHPEEWLEMKDERRVPLNQFLKKPRDRIEYRYDYGDDWEPDIVLEKILPAVELKSPVCTGGERAAPPEDSGGVWGYQEMLEIVQNPEHEAYDEYREWLGEDFDPDEFDLEAINHQLRRLR